MYRRSYLKGVATVAGAGAAGCLGRSDSTSTVALPEPDRQYSSSDLPYPAWGERIPDVTVPAPIEDRTVTLRDVGKPQLLTYFYSYCGTVCPVLISTMRSVQTHALNNGYRDAVEFFPLTFDPARDDADRLRRYGSQMNVDMDAGNWHFLRPASEARAEEVISDGFGVAFSKETSGSGDGTDGNDSNDGGGDGHDGEGYMFVHTAITHLVNGDGYVERAYRTKSPDADRIIADLKDVRNA